MVVTKFSLLAMSLVLTIASATGSGWLGKVVAFYRNSFFNDVKKSLPNIDMKASIQRAPPGYVDSAEWNLESVSRLLTTLRRSEMPRPLRRMLHQLVAPTRRHYISMSVAETFKKFPSLSFNHTNDFYYDINSDEYYMESEDMERTQAITDDSIIVVSNPVEARLPSARISVRLLKDIMMQRAVAAKFIPTTSRRIISWKKVTTKATTVSSSVSTAEDGVSGKPTTETGSTAVGNTTATVDDANNGTTTDATTPAASA